MNEATLKEWPIIFSTPMVQKILSGQKTMTRRLVGRHGPYSPDEKVSYYLSDLLSRQEAEQMLHDYPKKRWGVWSINEDGSVGFHPFKFGYCGPPSPVKPYAKLWVREAFVPRYFDDGKPGYRADWNSRAAEVCPEPKWKPSIHMPRALSRISLQVTGVRCEPLQWFGQDDAKKEGFENIECFKKLWNTLHDCNHGWNANPWVWVIEFRGLP